jgi:hypothetical protein
MIPLSCTTLSSLSQIVFTPKQRPFKSMSILVITFWVLGRKCERERERGRWGQNNTVIHRVTCLHPVFGPPFTPYPLFQWYPQSKDILLNLSMKCSNSAFNAGDSRLWKKERKRKRKELMPKEWGVLEISAHKRASHGGCLFQECLTLKAICDIKHWHTF